ncbi:MAG: acyl-CoA dehydrogenase [Leptospirales bacterium]|nr:acyl-CoA dehydrogenase [Leptospirales bacterium]
MLLHPGKADFKDFDAETRSIFQATIEFFEKKGNAAMKREDHEAVWVADFLEFLAQKQVFYKFLTPSAYGETGCRFDSARNTQFSEILGFYSLSHWYPWQVSILGLGPFWMSPNETAKKRAAAALKSGGVFGFGLSEKEHGADLIGTDMLLIPQGEGKYVARGDKYYIGNGNCAALLSVFARMENGKEYAFVSVAPDHKSYECKKNVVHGQKYVAEFELHDYPIAEDDILLRGRPSWDASLATVAYAKFNLGLAATGICTHAFYEAINHAGNRKLYGTFVSDFPHVKQLLGEAYARLCAMRLFAYRAKDYMRAASAEDRRYLLYNPMVKMKVTMQGEEVIDLLWDVIAARGFEKDMYFESATRDIRMLPKLEGTAHVNMVLVIKFMRSYLFDSSSLKAPPSSNAAAEENFLFQQGATTKGLDKVGFGDWRQRFAGRSEANVARFMEQAEVFCSFLSSEGPNAEQSKDLDLMLTVGELFTLIAYGGLVLEQAALQGAASALVDEIFDFQVRDFSKHAVTLYQKSSLSEAQQKLALAMVRRPAADESRSAQVHEMVMAHKGAYVMRS